jgi:hypothetical protein
MFSSATSFSGHLSAWNVSNVINMANMFHGASSFSGDISGWDVANMTSVNKMFYATTALSSVFVEMQVSSFFEGRYRDMHPELRRQAFSPVFHWRRRKAFMLFLVGQGYLHSAHVSINNGHQGAPCDSIFNVYDLNRYICKFL